MAVILRRSNPNSKPNWVRMLKAYHTVDEVYQPDARLKAGKGWEITTLDAIHICEVLDKNGIEYEKKSEHIIEIL